MVYAHDHRGHGATAAAAGEERLAQRRAEMQSHSLSELQRRATNVGADGDRLDAALDSKKPADALVTLLLEFEQGDAVLVSPHPSHTRTPDLDSQRCCPNDCLWLQAEEGFFSDEAGWQLAVDDAAKITAMIRGREQRGLPIVLYGHSMGSMLGRTLVAQYGTAGSTPEEWAGAAVSTQALLTAA